MFSADDEIGKDKRAKKACISTESATLRKHLQGDVLNSKLIFYI